MLYISPELIHRERELFLKIESYAKVRGIKILSINSESQVKTNGQEAIYIVTTEELKEFIPLVQNSTAFVCSVQGANLPLLFEDKEKANDSHQFLIENEQDIIELFEIIDLRSLFFLKDKEQRLKGLERTNLKSILSKEVISTLKSNEDLKSQVDLFEVEIYSCLDLIELKLKFSDLVDHYFSISSSIENLKEIKLSDEQGLNFLSISEEEAGECVFFSYESSAPEEVIALVYLVLKNYMKIFENTASDKIDWEEVFTLFPVPIVIISCDHELILHNTSFASLNLSIKKCTGLKDGDQLTIDKKLYRVSVFEHLDGNLQLSFVPAISFLDGEKEQSSEELGIVSSSIAHELNNPLAGALAALDVLGLDELEPEIEDKINDMRKGVLRCKKLVETFLGFSKLPLNVEDSSIKSELSSRYIFSDSWDLAVELVRFRLIENNLKLKFEKEVKSSFVCGINVHVCSMIFYLILNEYLTTLSHRNLVTRKKEDSMTVKIIEDFDCVTIECLDRELVLPQSFIESKLFLHLLKLEKITLQMSETKLVIKGAS